MLQVHTARAWGLWLSNQPTLFPDVSYSITGHPGWNYVFPLLRMSVREGQFSLQPHKYKVYHLTSQVRCIYLPFFFLNNDSGSWEYQLWFVLARLSLRFLNVWSNLVVQTWFSLRKRYCLWHRKAVNRPPFELPSRGLDYFLVGVKQILDRITLQLVIARPYSIYLQSNC